MKRNELLSLFMLVLAILFAVMGAGYDTVTLVSQQYGGVLLLSAGFIALSLAAATVGFFWTRTVTIKAAAVLLGLAGLVVLVDVVRRLLNS